VELLFAKNWPKDTYFGFGVNHASNQQKQNHKPSLYRNVFWLAPYVHSVSFV